MGTINIKDMTTLSNQIMIISLTFIGISVARIQGIDAEKNKISLIHRTAIMNLTSILAPVEIIAGTYISAIVIVADFAIKNGSEVLKNKVKG